VDDPPLVGGHRLELHRLARRPDAGGEALGHPRQQLLAPGAVAVGVDGDPGVPAELLVEHQAEDELQGPQVLPPPADQVGHVPAHDVEQERVGADDVHPQLAHPHPVDQLHQHDPGELGVADGVVGGGLGGGLIARLQDRLILYDYDFRLVLVEGGLDLGDAGGRADGVRVDLEADHPDPCRLGAEAQQTPGTAGVEHLHFHLVAGAAELLEGARDGLVDVLPADLEGAGRLPSGVLPHRSSSAP
jgi:hypothetical protein